MNFFKKIFGRARNASDSKPEKTLNIADSSSIPEEERKYYQADEYYAFTLHEGTFFEFTVIPFEERKKTSIPSDRGLYVPEILMLTFCSSFPNPKNGYPGYWWFKYGVRDVGAMLKSLEYRGFIEIDKTSGKYQRTPLGDLEAADNEYVAYTHRHSQSKDFTPWEFNLILGDGDKSNWVEIYCQKTGDLPPLDKTNTVIQKYDPNRKQAIKPRAPLSTIQNRQDWIKGFDQSYPHYQKGEQLRKAGDIYASIDEFDKARSKGYGAPALYWSYAMAFRKLKDYDNELDILNEAFCRGIVNEDEDNRFTQRKARVLMLMGRVTD